MAAKMAPGMAKMVWPSSGIQGQLGIIVSVFCLYKEHLIFTLQMLPEVTGVSVAARIHKQSHLQLDIPVHAEVSHLPGPATPRAIRGFEKKCIIIIFFVSFGKSLMQDFI